jgi:hypothetical protein
MANEYKLTGAHAEVFASWDSAARLHGAHAEVFASWDSAARLHGAYVEVWRSIEDAGSRRRNASMIIQ